MPAHLRSRHAALIGRRAKTVTLRDISKTTDPDTGQTVTTSVDDDVPGAILQHDIGLINGTNIQQNDIFVRVAAELIEAAPDIGDRPSTLWKMLIDGRLHQIVGVRPLWLGEDVASYDIQVRP